MGKDNNASEIEQVNINLLTLMIDHLMDCIRDLNHGVYVDKSVIKGACNDCIVNWR